MASGRRRGTRNNSSIGWENILVTTTWTTCTASQRRTSFSKEEQDCYLNTMEHSHNCCKLFILNTTGGRGDLDKYQRDSGIMEAIINNSFIGRENSLDTTTWMTGTASPKRTSYSMEDPDYYLHTTMDHPHKQCKQ